MLPFKMKTEAQAIFLIHVQFAPLFSLVKNKQTEIIHLQMD
jgi:hypothetical protein